MIRVTVGVVECMHYIWFQISFLQSADDSDTDAYSCRSEAEKKYIVHSSEIWSLKS